MLKNKFSFILFLALGLLSACNMDEHKEDNANNAEEQNEDKFNSKEGEKDAQFVVDVISGGYKEIRLSNYGAEKSPNAEISSMAIKMEKDHNALVGSLKEIAASKSISVPTEDSLEAAKAINDLKDVKMSDFDKEWTDKMIDLHRGSISKMESGLNEVTDPEIKNWIETSLPTVRSHFDMLNQMKQGME
jgi:putative membrane protein